MPARGGSTCCGCAWTLRGRSKVLCACGSDAASTRACAADGEAPRTAISTSRGSLTCGLTIVTVSVLSLTDADPERPQIEPGASTR